MIVLMYHALEGEGEFDISLDEFEKQLKYFSENNQDVMVTFDDGEKSNYNALPILKKYNHKAIFFLIPYHWNHNHAMSEEQVKKLIEKGMIIGSHTFNHKNLIELDDNEIEFELKKSKKFLEEKLGIEVEYLSIPYGNYDSRVVEIAKNVGYKNVFTSEIGKVEGDSFLINRICVKKGESVRDILNKIK